MMHKSEIMLSVLGPKNSVNSEKDTEIHTSSSLDYWLNELYSQDSSNFALSALNHLFSSFQEKAENAHSHKKKEHKI